MIGIVPCLLITILATAVAANYEYNAKHVTAIRENLLNLPKFQVKLHNTDSPVEWEAADKRKTEIHFQVNPHSQYTGRNCGGGPALTINNGPMYCLFEMLFQKTFNINSGIQGIQLGVLFKNSEDSSDRKVVLIDVFTKPNKDKRLPGVVYLEPITGEQISKMRLRKSFEGSTSSLLNILKNGIYKLNLDLLVQTSNVNWGKIERFAAHPIVMDADTLKAILASPPVL